MLTASFFAAILLSASWVTYMGIYIKVHLAGVSLGGLGLADLGLYTVVMVLPIFAIWSVWGYFYQFIRAGTVQKQLQMFASQIKQTQEYSDMLARILIQTGKDAADDFVLSKIGLFIGEMNEILYDILLRYNLIPPNEVDKLWNRVEKGNRWGFAKAIIHLKNSTPGFENKLFDIAGKENLLSAALFEFCARYAKLMELLHTHDTRKIFSDIIESGAFGRVFAIFAPITDRIRNPISVSEEELIEEIEEIAAIEEEPMELFIQDEFENIEELPDEEEGFFGKFDRENKPEQKELEKTIRHFRKKKALMPKISNVFKKRKKTKETVKAYADIDPLTLALERSFGKLSNPARDIIEGDEPTNDKFAFASTTKTLKNLQKEWEEIKQLEQKGRTEGGSDKASDE